MDKWFKYFPFSGWIIVVLLLLVGDVALYQYERAQYSPDRLALKIQEDFSAREQRLTRAVHQCMAMPSSSDYENFFSSFKEDFSVIVFNDSTPLFWNTSEIPSMHYLMTHWASLFEGKVIHLQAGIFYGHSYLLPNTDKYIVTLIPIAYQYKYPHKYFHSHFVAGRHIPSGATVGEEGYRISKLSGAVAFHVAFNRDTYRLFKVDGWVGLLTCLLLMSCFIWVHKMCIDIGKRFKPIVGWLMLLLVIMLLNILRNELGYPSGFENAGFFSPGILASGTDISSFPDLCFYILFDTWLCLFFVKYVPVRGLLPVKNKALSYCITGIIVIGLAFELFYGQAGYMYSLVMDSKLSFIVNDLQNLTVYTFLGIGLMCLITLNFIFIINIINKFLKELCRPVWVHYLIFIGVCLLSILLLHTDELITFNLVLLLFAVIDLWLLKELGPLIPNLADKKTFSSKPHAYIWFFILCSWVTMEIFFFNYSKERELRRIYAGRQEQQQDALLHFSFSSIAQELQKDRLLKTFWSNPSDQAGQSIDKHIIFHYLGGPFQKYHATVFYYDAGRSLMPHQDTLGRVLLQQADSLMGIEMESGLISLKNPLGKNVYWGIFPVYDTTGSTKLGYVGIDFSANSSPRKSPISMLLLPENNPSDEQYFKDYSYAIYREHKLEAQGGSFSFPFRSYFDAQNKSYTFKDHWNYSDLFYQATPQKLILVRYQRNIGANVISLFSYVLAVWLALAGLFLLLSYFVIQPRRKVRLWHNRFNLTIRAKVTWTILVTVFLSLIVVGSITVSFLKSRYQETQHQNLRNLMFYFGQSIAHFIEDQQSYALDDQYGLNQYPPLDYLLNTLAGEQGLDINLYNDRGVLVATSQSLLMQKGYLSTLMNRDALSALKSGMQPDWQGFEKIGRLKYQSLYLPLRNKHDEILAYLNIPYYGSQSDLKSEISGILTTLINIYMLIFFIGGIAAFLISNSIVRSFYLLIEQFRKIRLEHNVLIHWPYQDELNLLVVEYNNMILKVEKMAERLAESEREAAWRDLALQIAHEIKNPLTPMKLNIQFLLKAMKEKRSNVVELAERISNSLIEQIENLNLIASEFAHFARMPKAHPEIIDVEEQLQSLVGLYQKEGINIRLNAPPEDIQVWMDKGYFIRIFTNLIKNAIQSIPHYKEGVITLSVSAPAGRQVRIAVEDNGTGIPDEVQKRIFTPYFTTKSSGSGIGLAMAKNMAELSEGLISFTTEQDRGTIFFVILPQYHEHIPEI